jgi:hypothetical protein
MNNSRHTPCRPYLHTMRWLLIVVAGVSVMTACSGPHQEAAYAPVPSSTGGAAYDRRATAPPAPAPAATAPAPQPASRIAPVAVTPTGPKIQAELGHGYPALAESPVNFTVTAPGFVLVPISSGVFVAGWRGWLIPPSEQPVESVAARGKALYLLRQQHQQVVLVQRAQPFSQTPDVELAMLPAGAYHLAAVGDGSLWLWGKQADGTWIVAQHGDRLQRVYASKLPVTAVAPVGEEAVVIAVGRVVMLLRRGYQPAPVLVTQEYGL